MKESRTHNKTYRLRRVNGCQQGSRPLASFSLRGQESALKPPTFHILIIVATNAKNNNL